MVDPKSINSDTFNRHFTKNKEKTLQADQTLPLISLLLFAFGSNLPLGYIRETTRKFSPLWFLLIHASIPFIIVLRITLGFNWCWIPLTLGCAVAGQIIGARIRKKRDA